MTTAKARSATADRVLRRAAHARTDTAAFEIHEFSWDNAPITFADAIEVCRAALDKGWLLKQHVHRLHDDQCLIMTLSFFKWKEVRGVWGVGGHQGVEPCSTPVLARDEAVVVLQTSTTALEEVKEKDKDKEARAASIEQVLMAYEKIFDRKPKRTALLLEIIEHRLKHFTLNQLVECFRLARDNTPFDRTKGLRALLSESKIRAALGVKNPRFTWLTPYVDAFDAMFPTAIFPMGPAAQVFKQIEQKHTGEIALAEFKRYLTNCQQSGYAVNLHVFARRFGTWAQPDGRQRYQAGLVTKDPNALKDTLS